MSSSSTVVGEQSVENKQDVVEEERPSRVSFAIPGLLLILVVGFLIFNYIRESRKRAEDAKYRAYAKPLPVVETTIELRENIPYTPGISWEPLSANEQKKFGTFNILPVALNPMASGGIDESLIGEINATPVSDDTSTQPPPDETEEQKEIDQFLLTSASKTPEQLALTKCADGANALFFSATRFPDGDLLAGSSWGEGKGYCVKKCSYERVDKPTQFINEKDEHGNYKVNYELKFWISPKENSASYAWYCRAVPNPKYDGVGWSAANDGIYQRREISPVFYSSDLDPFDVDFGSRAAMSPAIQANFDTDMALCSGSSLPIPTIDQLRGEKYAFGTRWQGKPDQSDMNYIGYKKSNYRLVDFQMIGRYCHWVGHDDYRGGDNSSAADKNFHGNFSKIPLQGSCPKNQRAPDGEVYDMQLTPGNLSCYYCPKIYEYDEVTSDIVGYRTLIRGNETDGYKCMRPCPTGMTDGFSGPLNWCIPIGIAMETLPPLSSS